MAKLAWVLVPPLLVITALLWRGPPRAVLNAALSLLLLAYVGTTAGLGLFWVANQQLPAFDWHYLFGYATLALLAVHLTFNLPAVWRVLRRRRAGADGGGHPKETAIAGTSGAAGAQRRPLLLATGAIAGAAGLGYAIGLRHGRVELRFDTGAAAASAPLRREGSAAQAMALVQAFHALSSHSRASVLRHAGTAQWGAAPPPFKRYAGAERLALPAPGSVVRTDAPPGELPLLAEVLWHTAGVSLVRGGIHFRTSPSSGALFATELYVAGPAAGALRGRWWHYDAERHALESIERPAASDGAAAFALPSRGGESLLVVATAVFARSGHKYGDRTWRYVLADAGHALENLLRVAHGLGAGAWLEPHFDDAAVAAALALDERREGVLALLQLVAEAAAHRPNGAGNTSAAAAPSERAAGFVWHATPLRAADSAADLTAAMQRASSLRATRPLAPDAAAAASAAAPASATAGSPASPRELVALPPPRDLPADVRSLIARRRSIRRYGARALGLQELSTVLAAAQDVHAARTRAVHVDLVAIRVSGLAAGAWSAGDLRGGLARRAAPPRSDWASSARAAGLDQDVIREAAVVLVLSLDRAALAADPAGPVRAYRHAFIEAGRAGERVYLAAGQHGLGCCSVGAFYDDEVAALLGRDPAQHWAIHIVALGPLA